MSTTKHKMQTSGAKEHRVKERKWYNAITDVAGIEVGHCTDLEHLTGTTVVLARDGAVAGVDVRGSAPGTRETDLLNPVNLIEKVYAVVLTGGSAYGLAAADGVMNYLEKARHRLSGRQWHCCADRAGGRALRFRKRGGWLYSETGCFLRFYRLCSGEDGTR